MTFLAGDRVWVVDARNEKRYKGIVETVRDESHELTVQIDNGPRLRVFQGACTLRESHE